jgi:3-oxoacyl-[acyl-carrier-protein] synthase-3
LLRASHFEAELRARAGERADHVRLDEEFLRWMLSDGAGAVVVEPRGRPGALEVEWIELHSYAHEHPTCMYMGARRTAEGGLLGWRDLGVDEAVRSGAFNLHQDVKLLEASIVPVCARSLAGVQAQHPFASSDVSWFLPHYSSEHFRAATAAGLAAAGLDVPADRWASNLAERGNTGAASVFVMLDELWRSGRVSPGQRLLLMVPESGRFSCAWAMLRAV